VSQPLSLISFGARVSRITRMLLDSSCPTTISQGHSRLMSLLELVYLKEVWKLSLNSSFTLLTRTPTMSINQEIHSLKAEFALQRFELQIVTFVLQETLSPVLKTQTMFFQRKKANTRKTKESSPRLYLTPPGIIHPVFGTLSKTQ